MKVVIPTISMLKKYLFGFRGQSVLYLASWIFFIPQFCARTTCPPPDYPDGGNYIPRKAVYRVGQNVTYFCMADRLLKRERYEPITCEATGRWSQNTPFCDRRVRIENAKISSRGDGSREDAALMDDNTNSCFKTRNSTNEYLVLVLEHKVVVYAVKIYFPLGSKGTFNIYILKNKNTPTVEREFCSSFNADRGDENWFETVCKDNNMIAEALLIQAPPETPSVISMCEIQVFLKEDNWCEEPPKNFVPHSQLKVGRSKAILSCYRIFVEKDNKRTYATCENNRWSYRSLHCTGHICDPVVGNISSTEGEWDNYGTTFSTGAKRTLKCNAGYRTRGEPLTVTCQKNGMWTDTTATCIKTTSSTEYKNIAIAIGSIAVIAKICAVGITIYYKRKKKAKEVVLIHKSPESNLALTSVDANSKTRLTEEKQD